MPFHVRMAATLPHDPAPARAEAIEAGLFGRALVTPRREAYLGGT